MPLLKEPLLYFFRAGLVLFGAYTWLSVGNIPADDSRMI